MQKALAGWLAEHRDVRVVAVVPTSGEVGSLVVLALREQGGAK